MTLRVYFDDSNGILQPLWLLVPVRFSKEYEEYILEGPVDRFFSEDFHDCLSFVSVTQAALLKGPEPSQFKIHIPTVVDDLNLKGRCGELIGQADYFLIMISDLEEVLHMNMERVYKLSS
ncbi:hypothetical protein [Alkalihalobacillus sp. LMS39]|uniref:hypothetical protein n=1 Tax=Alkalihalobacillus sp. LMS39 TaxID=2924032 RepID=UPI001FB3F8AB|nr:hypothetical protein [Alkalihalobacillus sp. LMS39]UOE96041.1 hypothetical protein MM271_10770 [Alkalihalobacillus sp. LMS39]